MSRYIDADKIDYTMASVYWGKDNKGRDEYRRTFVAFRSDIDELPAADVVEVRHSHWVVCGTFDDFLKCSSCGYDRPWQTAIEHKYCPNCGAKMDGERSENGT